MVIIIYSIFKIFFNYFKTFYLNVYITKRNYLILIVFNNIYKNKKKKKKIIINIKKKKKKNKMNKIK